MKLVLPLIFIKASLFERDPSFARLFSMVLNPSGWNLFLPLYGFFGSYSNKEYPSQTAYLMDSWKGETVVGLGMGDHVCLSHTLMVTIGGWGEVLEC